MEYLVENVMEESVSNLEFMFNFDDIVSKGQNDEYRYKFKKNATKITEKKIVGLKVIDKKDGTVYTICMKDYFISVNPFLSRETYFQLMNVRYRDPVVNQLTSYQRGYITYLRQSLQERLKEIQQKAKDPNLTLKLDQVVKYINESFGWVDKKAEQALSNCKDLDEIIEVVKGREFRYFIGRSKKFAKFVELTNQPVMSKLDSVEDARGLRISDRIQARKEGFLEKFTMPEKIQNKKKEEKNLIQKLVREDVKGFYFLPVVDGDNWE